SDGRQVLREEPGNRRRGIPQLPREREIDERYCSGHASACRGNRLLVVVRPAQSRDIEGPPGPRDRDVDEARLLRTQGVLHAIVIDGRRAEARTDSDAVPLPALRLVRRGDRDPRVLLLRQAVYRLDDRLLTVGVD